ALIAIKRISAITSDIEVELAVVIEVGDGNSHPPTFAAESGGLGDVGELAVGFLVIKRHQRIATLVVAFDGGTIHDDQVRATIIVTIEKAETAAHGFNYVTFIGSGDVGGRDAKFSRDILKLGHRHGTGRLLLPCGGR